MKLQFTAVPGAAIVAELSGSLQERGIAFREVNIDDTPEAVDIIVRVNNGRRKVPTIEVDGRFFACSPFDPYQLAEELKIPLNP